MTRGSHSTRAHAPARPGGQLTGRVKVLLAALAAVAAVTALYHSDIAWRDIPGLLERVNRPLALAMMATLPIVGFPVSAVYLAAGALFGPLLGGAVVALVTLVHMLAVHALGRTVLRRRIEGWRKKWQDRVPGVPEGEFGTLIAMIVIVPGPPYLARNGLLVLSGAPLRLLLLVGVPLYVARSYVTIFLGDLGNDPSLRALLILLSVFAVKLTISALLLRRLAHRVKRRGTGRTPRAGHGAK